MAFRPHASAPMDIRRYQVRRRPGSLRRCVCSLGLLIVAGASLVQLTPSAAEFTARGTVTREVNFYDREGKLMDHSPEHDFPLVESSEFVYFRKGSQWRLNIVQNYPDFPRSSVWRSIRPFSEKELIDIISFPERTNVTGNAAVTITTSRWLTPDSAAVHFVWTVFNFEELKGLLGPRLECHAFWKAGMPVDPGILTHRIIDSGSHWTYWNGGKFAQQDGQGHVVLVGGRPVIQSYPAPLDRGFSEGECQIDWIDLNTARVPKKATATFMGPLITGPEKKATIVPLWKVELVVDSLATNAVDDAVFEPTWTNSVASVVDHRVTNRQGAPLSFLTRTNLMDSSPATLQQHRKIFAIMNSLPTPARNRAATFWKVLLGILVAAPFFFFWIRRKA